MLFYLEIVTCDSLNYTMDHSKFIASIQKEEFFTAVKGSAEQQSLNYMFQSCKFRADVTH